MVDGLTIAEFRDSRDNATGRPYVYVALAELPWVEIPGTGLIDRIRDRISRLARGMARLRPRW